MSNGSCTTKRNCVYARVISCVHLAWKSTPTVNVWLRVLNSEDKRNSRFFQLKDVPLCLVWMAYCLRLNIASHKKFRNIALNCSFRNAQEKWSICNWMLKNMYKPDNSPSKVFIKWSRHHWLAYKIVDYLSSIFKTHSSFRSYNLRSTIDLFINTAAILN